VIGDSVTALPPDVGALVNAEMLGLSGRLSNSLEDKIRLKDQKDADAGLMVYREQMQRFATTDMATAVKQWESVARQSGAQAGWSPEKIEKEVQTFREGVAYTKAYSTVSAARDMKGLQAAEAMLGQLPDLDPQKRATLENTITTRRMALNQQADMEANRRALAAEASFRRAEAECQRALEAQVPIAAYEQAIEASHLFNLLQARGVISVQERASYIGRVRDLAKCSCQAWIDKNKAEWEAKFPGWTV
jgi:hypothetical protein